MTADVPTTDDPKNFLVSFLLLPVVTHNIDY